MIKYNKFEIKSYIYAIYKENNHFQLFWADFHFPKIPSIFNTNNTCNK